MMTPGCSVLRVLATGIIAVAMVEGARARKTEQDKSGLDKPLFVDKPYFLQKTRNLC